MKRFFGVVSRLRMIAGVCAALGCSDSVTPERVPVTVEGFVTSELDGHALPGFLVELGMPLEEPSRTVTDSSGWYQISAAAGYQISAAADPDSNLGCALVFRVNAPPSYSEEGGIWYFGGAYHGPYRGDTYNVIGELDCASGVQRIDWTFVPRESVPQ